jgi:hypothetical protein
MRVPTATERDSTTKNTKELARGRARKILSEAVAKVLSLSENTGELAVI